MPRTGNTFRSPDQVIFPDNCEPLRTAVQAGETRLSALARSHYPSSDRLPAGALPELLSVGYWDAPKAQSWGLDWHYNEGIEVSYVSRGHTGFAVDDQVTSLRRGDLTITRPWQAHRVGDPNVGACRLHWLILDVGVRRPHQTWRFPQWLAMRPADLRRLTELLQHNEQPVWRSNADIEASFKRLGKLVSCPPGRTRESRLQLEIGRLFVDLLDLLDGQQILLDSSLSSSRRSAEILLSALPSRLEEDWSLERMAQECSLGRTQFVHRCREITGMTPNQYLQECRVRAARRYLAQHLQLSITDIAELCGFESSQYFATVFHQHTGFTASHYRAERAHEGVENVQQVV